jgi:hypothetical protein
VFFVVSFLRGGFASEAAFAFGSLEGAFAGAGGGAWPQGGVSIVERSWGWG